MHRVYPLLLLAIFSNFCIIERSKKEYYRSEYNENTKDTISNYHLKALSINGVSDSDLSLLMVLISKKVYGFEKVEIDTQRIHIIKKTLSASYGKYRYNRSIIRDDEFESRLTCYVDYMLNPKNEESKVQNLLLTDNNNNNQIKCWY